MKTFIVNIKFDLPDNFMDYIPEHRKYINSLINNNVIESYAVSMESKKSWIIINAESKIAVDKILVKSTLYRFWTYNIDELFVYDSQNFRLPKLQLN